MTTFLIAFTLMAAVSTQAVYGETAHKESDYVQHWCEQQGGVIQPKTTTGDQYRADCATATHIIEVDFAWKFWEALGQILNYGYLYGKEMGIVLILKTQKDDRHLIQLKAVIRHHNLLIDVWSIRPEDLAKS